jgi:hypothetical protein
LVGCLVGSLVGKGVGARSGEGGGCCLCCSFLCHLRGEVRWRWVADKGEREGRCLAIPCGCGCGLLGSEIAGEVTEVVE